MVDFEKEFETPSYRTESRTTLIARTFRIVYGWMSAGLALSGVLAWYTAMTPSLSEAVLPHLKLLLIAEVLVVLGLTAALNKIPVFFAYLLFLGYAALNGLTLSAVFLVYDLAVIQKVFFITSGMFAGLALWGTFTKNDLTSIGSFCGMALWGLIIAGLVNLFMHSERLDFICSFVGVLVFVGLTMYDAQKIKTMATQESQLDTQTLHRVGIMGALALYLDFINLFLHILRYFGRKR